MSPDPPEQSGDLNDPDYVWLVFKRVDTGELLGPLMKPYTGYMETRVVHAKLLDNGQWEEVK